MIPQTTELWAAWWRTVSYRGHGRVIGWEQDPEKPWAYNAVVFPVTATGRVTHADGRNRAITPMTYPYPDRTEDAHGLAFLDKMELCGTEREAQALAKVFEEEWERWLETRKNSR